MRLIRWRADARAAHGDDADLLVGPVAQALPQFLARAECLRMLAHHIAREVEVPGDPVAHRRQILAEGQRHDVLRIADKDRAVAHAGMALDMLDHLGVVVGRQESLVLAARRHRHEADEVGEPGERCLLQLGMLVPVVVDVPGLVGDHEVVAAGVDGILEDHEVGDQHLVHAADRLEGVEIVLARLPARCAAIRWRGARCSGWMRSPLASSRRVTGSCASQSTCRRDAACAIRGRWRCRGGRARGRWARTGRAPSSAAAHGWTGALGAPRPSRRSRKSLIRALHLAGKRPSGLWPPPAMVTNSPPVSSATSLPRAWGWI